MSYSTRPSGRMGALAPKYSAGVAFMAVVTAAPPTSPLLATAFSQCLVAA